MRNLTSAEISSLEKNGCKAQNWGCVRVANNFTAERNNITNVEFCGNVQIGCCDGEVDLGNGVVRGSGIYNVRLEHCTVGDNAYIKDVFGGITNYTIGDNSVIVNVGAVYAQEFAKTGYGKRIAVLNEAGNPNIVLHPELSAQEAALMVEFAGHAFMQAYFDRICLAAASARQGGAEIGRGVKIVNTKEIFNSNIEDGAVIYNASRISESEINSGAKIGDDVICSQSIVGKGASVLSGAKVSSCFVGEAANLSSGFSATDSLFFANCTMSNGEACAAFCGPFTVSHHRSSLLIGGMFSFYNAGSGTNFSNHAYKSGPVHYGFMQRGSKTASNAHVLWPATIAPFTMVMGKIDTHPLFSDFPFSYVIGNQGKVWLVPGANFATLGTYRDTQKWAKRDERSADANLDMISYDWLHPYILQKIIKAYKQLKVWDSQCTSAEYQIEGNCYIKQSAIKKGLAMYDLALKMGFGCNDCLDDIIGKSVGIKRPYEEMGEWIDLQGIYITQRDIDKIKEFFNVRSVNDSKGIQTPSDLRQYISGAVWNNNIDAITWFAATIMKQYGKVFIDAQFIDELKAAGVDARAKWIELIKADAKKEFAMGDIAESELNATLESIK